MCIRDYITNTFPKTFALSIHIYIYIWRNITLLYWIKLMIGCYEVKYFPNVSLPKILNGHASYITITNFPWRGPMLQKASWMTSYLPLVHVSWNSLFNPCLYDFISITTLNILLSFIVSPYGENGFGWPWYRPSKSSCRLHNNAF